jgi:hypothetical protein
LGATKTQKKNWIAGKQRKNREGQHGNNEGDEGRTGVIVPRSYLKPPSY